MIDRELLNLLPPLRRARGDRLYGPDQKHWVDLWKQDGAWLLGHRPQGAAKEWKNQVDKGLAAWAPSAWPRRLERQLQTLLPGTTAVRIFRNADRAEAFLGGPGPRAQALWRPWDDRPAPGAGVTWPVLPTGPGQAVALAFGSPWVAPLPEDDVTSPAEAAGLVQAAAEVVRFTADPRFAEARAGVGAAFDRWLGPTGVFRRSGLWFKAVEGVDYRALFRTCFDAGFVLNPDPTQPSLLPLELSEGEWTAWRAAVQAPAGRSV